MCEYVFDNSLTCNVQVLLFGWFLPPALAEEVMFSVPCVRVSVCLSAL